MKSFKYWKRQEVEETFDLSRLSEMDLLTEWLKVNHQSITEKEREAIIELRQLLKKFIISWNKAELKFHFLGPFMGLIKLYSDKYNSFVERSLTAIIGNETSSGNIDFLVAAGEQIPRVPYFLLHEYKPEEGTSNDPIGQLLIAMIAAQQANHQKEINFPIYGSYVIGRNFYFVVLNQKEYALSDAYTATQDDIFDIFSIFKKTKAYIDSRIK